MRKRYANIENAVRILWIVLGSHGVTVMQCSQMNSRKKGFEWIRLRDGQQKC